MQTAILFPITNPQQNRRYYLHRRLKKHCHINAKKRALFLPMDATRYMSTRQCNYLKELRDRHSYTVQWEIPM